ncbi:glycosyltransferase [Neobacillus pocheonensis]|uniref:Glycosyltransferase n=1 Tax=Neobacillus pocheonensis TaxID=363869 RepID=A0ABT0WJW0_9BACI|nr:glycosyltransferase [Neobacillus pocheonensis]
MNNIKPLISIIIPTYGRPNLLLRAIDSVLNQSYNNLEIIVVDDNNPESFERQETMTVLEKYLELNKIIYIKLEKNSGGAIARNRGVEVSTGKLICFLDDDDEFLPNKVELQVNKFVESDFKLSVVGGFANILGAEGNLKRIEKNEVNGDVFKIQLSSNVCTTSIAMINKDVFIRSGGFSNVPSSQEHTLFIKIFNVNPLYDYVNVPVVNIYHHDGERISTGKKKAEGAIILHEYVSSFYSMLKEEEIKEIDNAHYINIIRAYMHIKNNRINAYKNLCNLIINKKHIDKEVIKCFLVICLGFNIIERFKMLIK